MLRLTVFWLRRDGLAIAAKVEPPSQYLNQGNRFRLATSFLLTTVDVPQLTQRYLRLPDLLYPQQITRED